MRISLLLVCAVVCLHGVCLTAEDAGLPKDPAALMALGVAKNGLNGADVKPWHIRGTFTLYDLDGKPEDKGVYEEWWASSELYKVSYASSKFTQTDYASGGKLFREGAQEWSGAEIALRTALLEPLPETAMLKDLTLKIQNQSLGKTKLACVSLIYPIRSNFAMNGNFYPMYCFDSASPVLRLGAGGGGFQIVYNQLISFQGHYLSRTLECSMAGKPRFDLTLDVVETMSSVPDSFPEIPTDAKPVDLSKISFPATSGRYGAMRPLRTAVPVYPQSAKDERVQGTVVIKGTIEVDGHVDNLTVTDGPKQLQKGALDAVSQWIYRPLRVMGEVRPVQIEINVIFTLG